VSDARPCIDALVDENSGLQPGDQMENWREVEQLMSDKTSQTNALGWFDPNRVENDYALVKTYLGIDRQFDPSAHYTNEFLDQSIKMKPGASAD
jgi:NitT/TauT family transport system substrate-binding protein